MHRDRIPLPNAQVSHNYTDRSRHEHCATIVLTSTELSVGPIGEETDVRGKSRPTDSARGSGNYEPDLQSPSERNGDHPVALKQVRV